MSGRNVGASVVMRTLPGICWLSSPHDEPKVNLSYISACRPLQHCKLSVRASALSAQTKFTLKIQCTCVQVAAMLQTLSKGFGTISTNVVPRPLRWPAGCSNTADQTPANPLAPAHHHQWYFNQDTDSPLATDLVPSVLINVAN